MTRMLMVTPFLAAFLLIDQAAFAIVRRI